MSLELIKNISLDPVCFRLVFHLAQSFECLRVHEFNHVITVIAVIHLIVFLLFRRSHIVVLAVAVLQRGVLRKHIHAGCLIQSHCLGVIFCGSVMCEIARGNCVVDRPSCHSYPRIVRVIEYTDVLLDIALSRDGIWQTVFCSVFLIIHIKNQREERNLVDRLIEYVLEYIL